MNLTLQSPPSAEVSLCIQTCELPVWKRVLDVCGAAVAAILLAPLFIIVALYIRFVSPGPILFVQPRVGFGGDDFVIYKFRTMHVPKVSRDATHRDYVASHARVDGPIKKPSYQSDLIFGGDVLRKLSIDELPQLFNVMRGDMSLVGPRPDVLRLDDYETWQLRRFEVLPGMTGLWQVSGKNRLTFDQMIELDIKYIETRSLAKDLLIMARTVKVLVLERNE